MRSAWRRTCLELSVADPRDAGDVPAASTARQIALQRMGLPDDVHSADMGSSPGAAGVSGIHFLFDRRGVVDRSNHGSDSPPRAISPAGVTDTRAMSETGSSRENASGCEAGDPRALRLGAVLAGVAAVHMNGGEDRMNVVGRRRRCDRVAIVETVIYMVTASPRAVATERWGSRAPRGAGGRGDPSWGIGLPPWQGLEPLRLRIVGVWDPVGSVGEVAMTSSHE